MTKLSEHIDAVDEGEALFPVKAEFGVGTYDDGSGPILTVGYDATETGNLQGRLLIDGYALTIPHEHSEELISVIRYCAAALKARGL